MFVVKYTTFQGKLPPCIRYKNEIFVYTCYISVAFNGENLKSAALYIWAAPVIRI